MGSDKFFLTLSVKTLSHMGGSLYNRGFGGYLNCLVGRKKGKKVSNDFADVKFTFSLKNL